MPVPSKGLYGSALLSSAILLSFTVAHAQQMGPSPRRMGPDMMHQGQGMMHQEMMGGCGQDHGMMDMGMMHGPVLEGRLAYIKAELAITDAQSAAWNAYVSAVKARVSGMQAMHDGMVRAMQSGTAVARMDAHIKGMEAMTESLKAIKPATEALYAVLTPEQKQKADRLLATGSMMCSVDAH